MLAGICCSYCRLGFYSENAMFVSGTPILECAVKELLWCECCGVSNHCLWCSIALQSYILWISCLCQRDHSIEVADPDFIDVVTVQDERHRERRSVTVAIVRK